MSATTKSNTLRSTSGYLPTFGPSGRILFTNEGKRLRMGYRPAEIDPGEDTFAWHIGRREYVYERELENGTYWLLTYVGSGYNLERVTVTNGDISRKNIAPHFVWKLGSMDIQEMLRRGVSQQVIKALSLMKTLSALDWWIATLAESEGVDILQYEQRGMWEKFSPTRIAFKLSNEEAVKNAQIVLERVRRFDARIKPQLEQVKGYVVMWLYGKDLREGSFRLVLEEEIALKKVLFDAGLIVLPHDLEYFPLKPQ